MINFKKFIKYKPENQNEWKVYFLLYRKKIVYIGYTNNLTRRLQYHSHYYDPFMSGQMKCYLGVKKFTSYRYIVIKDKKKAYALEQKLIKKYMPLYNNNKNYYWKPTGKIIYSDKAISTRLHSGIFTKERTICEWTKKRGVING
jgi:predicted GIY-YIG superfamily endonuclease